MMSPIIAGSIGAIAPFGVSLATQKQSLRNLSTYPKFVQYWALTSRPKSADELAAGEKSETEWERPIAGLLGSLALFWLFDAIGLSPWIGVLLSLFVTPYVATFVQEMLK